MYYLENFGNFINQRVPDYWIEDEKLGLLRLF